MDGIFIDIWKSPIGGHLTDSTQDWKQKQKQNKKQYNTGYKHDDDPSQQQ